MQSKQMILRHKTLQGTCNLWKKGQQKHNFCGFGGVKCLSVTLFIQDFLFVFVRVSLHATIKEEMMHIRGCIIPTPLTCVCFGGDRKCKFL